ncbi:MAG: helix-turn-helix transcriptional regulator [Bacteroidaceae bacterium]|nr:helix-turn-helix transcriptional regulator [Bacteroidaceae bacterium]
MEQVGEFKLYTMEEVLDEHFGPIGTPERDEHERRVAEAVHAYFIGEAIKKARLEQNLTQEELGERIGVKRAQISKLEKGHCITIPTMSRVFKALGVATASLDLGGSLGKVALW